MKTRTVLATLMLLCVSGAALAEDKQETDPAEKKICRTEKVTGSRTKVSRICMTKAEWDELADKTRNNIGQMSRDASQPARGASSAFGDAPGT